MWIIEFEIKLNLYYFDFLPCYFEWLPKRKKNWEGENIVGWKLKCQFRKNIINPEYNRLENERDERSFVRHFKNI